MTHLDQELKNLKTDLLEMFGLVLSQIEKSKEALIRYDKDLAREVLVNEKRVNGFELKIDRDCENIIALFTPVAIDLRFVLACLKINSNLERIGDIADGIGQFILKIRLSPDEELLKVTRLIEMYDTCILILNDVMESFDKEDTQLARNVFKRDELLDEINLNANQAVTDYIKTHPDDISQSLYTLSTIRKLERLGDQCKNIAEEIIFIIEAKVLKHKSRSQKQE